MAITTAGRPASDINVTPMIDVLLVLLVAFFVLNLPIQFIPVQVPAPVVAATPGGEHQLVLDLPDGGGFTLNRQPVPVQELEAVLHSAFDLRPAKLLFVHAGPTRRYAEVVEAMDRARGAGVQVIAIMPQDAGR